ncbi:uncharacterized protein LOC144580763 [Callithrix jacchus]
MILIPGLFHHLSTTMIVVPGLFHHLSTTMIVVPGLFHHLSTTMILIPGLFHHLSTTMIVPCAKQGRRSAFAFLPQPARERLLGRGSTWDRFQAVPGAGSAAVLPHAARDARSTTRPSPCSFKEGRGRARRYVESGRDPAAARADQGEAVRSPRTPRPAAVGPARARGSPPASGTSHGACGLDLGSDPQNPGGRPAEQTRLAVAAGERPGPVRNPIPRRFCGPPPTSARGDSRGRSRGQVRPARLPAPHAAGYRSAAVQASHILDVVIYH